MKYDEPVSGLYVCLVSDIMTTNGGQLSVAEAREHQQLNSVVRRDSYLNARYQGKFLLSSLTGYKTDCIEILSRDASGRRTRPRVLIEGLPSVWQLSVSHKANDLLLAVTQRSDIRIGCDLEQVRPISNGFRQMWLTKEEQNCLNTHLLQETTSRSDYVSTVIWAAKEATYKATNQGEGFSPQRFRVHPATGSRWHCNDSVLNTTVECMAFPGRSKTEVAVLAIQQLIKGRFI